MDLRSLDSRVLALALGFGLLACSDDGSTDTNDGTESATGDGDPTTTGDGDPTTGDGDPTTTGDGDPTTTGDGDGDPTTTGDGDGDPGGDGCNMVDQDCDDAQKCVPYQADGGTGYKCVEVTGSQTSGQDCVYGGPVDATDDCDETSACWGAKDNAGQLVGTCLPFCGNSTDDPTCEDGSHCIVGGAEIYLCVEGCSPLHQDCGDSEGCYFDFNGQFECNGTTDGFAVGETCGFTNDCAPGLVCATASVVPDCAGEDCCVEYCDVSLDDSQCSVPGTSCNLFLPPAMAPTGYGHIGVCIEL